MAEDERQPFHMANDERPDSRVVQIIPANPGSWAELQEPGGELIRLPLACWALVEEDNGRGEWNVRYVVGMIGGAGDAVRLEAANSRPNFARRSRNSPRNRAASARLSKPTTRSSAYRIIHGFCCFHSLLHPTDEGRCWPAAAR